MGIPVSNTDLGFWDRREWNLPFHQRAKVESIVFHDNITSKKLVLDELRAFYDRFIQAQKSEME